MADILVIEVGDTLNALSMSLEDLFITQAEHFNSQQYPRNLTIWTPTGHAQTWVSIILKDLLHNIGRHITSDSLERYAESMAYGTILQSHSLPASLAKDYCRNALDSIYTSIMGVGETLAETLLSSGLILKDGRTMVEFVQWHYDLVTVTINPILPTQLHNVVYRISDLK